LRKEDVMARWREDEFFIILPYLSREDALRVANRIKTKLAGHSFVCGKHCINLKFSMGLVSFPEDVISNTRDVINALEKCLMNAKRRGGDVVVPYAQPRFPEKIEEKRKTNIQDLRNKLEKLNTMLTRDVLDMIYGFVRTIELKDSYTGEHMEYTAVIAEEIAKSLKLKDSEIENVRHAGVLHDLGKVGIDESILTKKGPLTGKEMDIIKAHPWIATEILREVHALVGAIPAVLYHHERFDGKGYPLGLKGGEIPLSARIVAVADVYQALISNRPYRKAFTRKKAIEVIKKSSGNSFDPEVVKVFLRIAKRLK
jgi:HD-GYP domain-containing protein (c-di-GMP phosphodiesterase class II)